MRALMLLLALSACATAPKAVHMMPIKGQCYDVTKTVELEVLDLDDLTVTYRLHYSDEFAYGVTDTQSATVSEVSNTVNLNKPEDCIFRFNQK